MDLPRGKRILSEKVENISTVYDRIPSDFRGLIRLFMKYDGRLHSGDLLVDDKHIIGISLDDLDKNKSVFGEEALSEMRAQISQAKGDVDLHRFSDVEMGIALSTNERILLRPGLPLVRFKELGGAPAAQAAPAAPVEPVPRRRDDEDRRRKEEEVRRKTEDDKRRADEEARRRADEDRKRRDEEDARRRDEESRRKTDDDRRKREEEERRKRPAAAEPKAAEAPKKPEDEEWMKELGKLDEEWGKLEEEWKKLESIKGLSVEDGGVAKAASAARPVELTSEDKTVLSSRPAVVKSIGFADKLRLLRFPSASNAVAMMDGKKSVGEIADSLKIDKKVLADLVKELSKRGYVK